jgi:putative addiction module CopG family antidote
VDVSLPPDLADFVSAKLATGQFATVDEVAIAAMRQCRDFESQDLEELRRMLKEADESIDRGEYIELADGAAIHEYFEGIKRRGRENLASERGNS